MPVSANATQIQSHSIEAGEEHFAYDKSPGERVNICKQCAPAIFEVAETHLAEVRKELGV